MNGANLFSSTIDNFVTIPVSKVLKTTHESIKHASEMKDDANNVKNDLNNILKLCSEFHKETNKINSKVKNGHSADSLLVQQPTPQAPAVHSGGAKNHSHRHRHAIHNSTRRIKKWVKRFSNTRKNHL